MECCITKKDLSAIEESSSFEDLLKIAFAIIKKMSKPVIQVCGPISSAGDGVDRNLKAIEDKINTLEAEGKSVFNQLIFERAFDRILNVANHQGYDMPILEGFYGPLFKSGLIDRIHLLPGWSSSIGARWEHDCAKRLGIEIIKDDEWSK